MSDASGYVLKRQRALADFGEFALRSDDLDAVLTEACRLVGEALGTGRAKVLEIEEERRSLSVRAGVGWAPGIVGRVRLSLEGRFPATRAVEIGGPVIVNYASREDRFDLPDFLKEAGVEALANVPVFLPGGRLFGLLEVDADEPRAFGEDDVQFLRTYATILGPVIDRLRKMRALSASEERARRIVEGVKDHSIFTTDAEGVVIDWTPGAEAVFGWRADEIVGRSEDLLFTLEDRAIGVPTRELAAAREEGCAADERWHVRRDGSRFFASGSVRPLHGRVGEVTGFIKIARDETERRAAEATLRESEARFQALVNSIDQMVWSTRPDGHHDFYNQRWYDYTGVPQGSTDGEAWNGVFHPEDQDRAWAVWRRSLETGEPYRIEYRLRHRSGAYRWVLGRAQAVHDAEGRITRWFGTCTDIEDIVEAREVLARSREELEREVAERTAERNLLATIVETTDLMVLALDLDYCILAINKASADEIERVYDVRPSVGDNMLALLADRPEDQAQVRAGWGRALAGEEVTFVEDFGDPTRARPYYEIKFRTLRNAAGERVGAYQFVTDVTERLRGERRLAEAQEALRQSQKMEAVGQLTGGLAHDFNNILAGVSGSLDLLGTRLAQGRVSDVERYMIAAQGAAKRAAALTHRLLAFSRRQTLEPKATDVNSLVADMEELIRRTVGPAIEVETVGKAGLWSTLVDPNQLENALLNLCINARDAMPEGGKLTIETANRWLDERAARARDLPPGQYVSLCVSDDGAGMTPEVVERAFDPFFTTKPIGQGTGLGLSMIYGFARQSGGQARIHSELGRGTNVCLYLPRHHGEEQVDAPRPPEEAKPADAGGTVLVIDDEPLVRMVVVDVLEELGHVAIEADDGPQGLKVLRSDAGIDLLITDVGLPNGMNGRQVAEAAREVRPNLKVLFITGYAENAVLNHGHLEHGMQVVTKPFDMQRLTSRIREMVAEGR